MPAGRVDSNVVVSGLANVIGLPSSPFAEAIIVVVVTASVETRRLQLIKIPHHHALMVVWIRHCTRSGSDAKNRIYNGLCPSCGRSSNKAEADGYLALVVVDFWFSCKHSTDFLVMAAHVGRSNGSTRLKVDHLRLIFKRMNGEELALA